MEATRVQRRHTKKACGPCYRRKAACDGGRPCGRCVRAGRSTGCVERTRADIQLVKGRRRSTVRKACASCFKAKTCCDRQRPCGRCARLGRKCEDRVVSRRSVTAPHTPQVGGTKPGRRGKGARRTRGRGVASANAPPSPLLDILTVTALTAPAPAPTGGKQHQAALGGSPSLAGSSSDSWSPLRYEPMSPPADSAADAPAVQSPVIVSVSASGPLPPSSSAAVGPTAAAAGSLFPEVSATAAGTSLFPEVSNARHGSTQEQVRNSSSLGDNEDMLVLDVPLLPHTSVRVPRSYMSLSASLPCTCAGSMDKSCARCRAEYIARTIEPRIKQQDLVEVLKGQSLSVDILHLMGSSMEYFFTATDLIDNLWNYRALWRLAKKRHAQARSRGIVMPDVAKYDKQLRETLEATQQLPFGLFTIPEFGSTFDYCAVNERCCELVRRPMHEMLQICGNMELEKLFEVPTELILKWNILKDSRFRRQFTSVHTLLCGDGSMVKAMATMIKLGIADNGTPLIGACLLQEIPGTRRFVKPARALALPAQPETEAKAVSLVVSQSTALGSATDTVRSGSSGSRGSQLGSSDMAAFYSDSPVGSGALGLVEVRRQDARTHTETLAVSLLEPPESLAALGDDIMDPLLDIDWQGPQSAAAPSASPITAFDLADSGWY